MNKPSLAAFLSRLSKRERLVFYVTAFIGGAVILDYLVLSPILSKMKQLNEQIESQKAEIKRSFTILSYEKQIGREREKYFSAGGDTESEEEGITAFLKEIENLAKESSVYLVDIKPSNKAEKSGPKQYLLDLNFEAQMDQLLSFFYDIQYSEKLIKIERYQIRPKAEGSSIVGCSMSISKLIVLK